MVKVCRLQGNTNKRYKHTSLDPDTRVVTTKLDVIIVQRSNNVVKDFVPKLNVLSLASIYISINSSSKISTGLGHQEGKQDLLNLCSYWLNFRVKVVDTFCLSVGVPKCIVRVTSVVPSLK